MRRRDVLIGVGSTLGVLAVRPAFAGISLATPWIARVDGHTVTAWSRHGAALFTVGGWGQAEGQLDHPGDALVDGLGRVWVADRGNDRVQVFAPDGGLMHVITEFAGQRLFRPTGLARFAGDLWVSDSLNHRVVSVRDERVVDGLDLPRGLTAWGDRLLVADGDHVTVIDRDGAVVGAWSDGALRAVRRIHLDGPQLRAEDPVAGDRWLDAASL